MKNKTILLTLLIPLMTGCQINNNKDNKETPSGDNTKTPYVEPTGEYVKEATKDKTFLEFFNPNSKVEIELDFTNEALINFREYGRGEGNDNFIENEMYHPCLAKITINGVTSTYEEVGARMKGNTTREYDFIKDDGHFDLTEKLCHYKINFSQTFDDPSFYYYHDWKNEADKKARDDRKFGGMKKLDLKWNRNEDETFTKEAYALSAFREEGVLAQHCTLVQLTVKSDVDSYTEIYQALESVDKRLLKNADKNDASGDLYKCTYTDLGPATLKNGSGNKIGVEGTKYRPIYNLKTNEDKSDHKMMKNFIAEVNKTYGDGYNGEQYYNNIKKYLDVDNFLKYSALCWVFGLPDDLRNNYNNYYIYFNKFGKALFLPYDNDRCFGIMNGWEKDMRKVSWDSTQAIGSNGFNQCPLILRLISGGSNNTHLVHEQSKEVYHRYCIEYAAKYLDEDKFIEYTNQFVYAPSHDFSTGGPENYSFGKYATDKKSTLD